MLLPVRAIALAAHINSPLGYRLLVRYHSDKDVTLDGAFEGSVVWIVRVASSFYVRRLPAPLAVLLVPPLKLRPVTERVSVYFLHGVLNKIHVLLAQT